MHDDTTKWQPQQSSRRDLKLTPNPSNSDTTSDDNSDEYCCSFTSRIAVRWGRMIEFAAPQSFHYNAQVGTLKIHFFTYYLFFVKSFSRS